MTTIPDSNPLTNPAAAEALTDSQWVELHVRRFSAAQPAYIKYTGFLEKVLIEAKQRFAPLAFVEARPKEAPSFAEKILRKRRDYQTSEDPLPPDPLVRLTDLCGGRVVTQTVGEVRMICQFIETAFDIDWPNSGDISQRLKPAEFGYRSVHYIVQVNPAKLAAAGIKAEIPGELLGFSADVLGPQAAGRPLKAEIQVRTLLEHAAASLGHDTLYKIEIQVPDRVKRNHATLSAILEDVDTGFGQLLASLKELESHYGAHFGRKAMDEEIARLRLVLPYAEDKIGLVLRIARFALASGQHETAVEALLPYRETGRFGVQRMLGQALTQMYWDQPKSPGFLDGRALLEAACAHPPRNSETLAMLADCMARDHDQKARELFHQAIQADATEPTTLSHYLEFEILHLGNDNAVRLSAPMITAAMIRCQRQIEGNVNLPAAWSSLAMFFLLVGKPFEALDAIAHLTVLCEERDGTASAGGGCGIPGRPCAAGRALSRLRDTLTRLQVIRHNLPGFDWCERAALLALAVRVADADARKSLLHVATWRREPYPFAPTENIVVLVGGCAAEIQNQIEELRPHLLRACEALSFKVLSGGTTAGISGLAGDAAESSGGRIRGIGYLPSRLPWGIKEDTNLARYSVRVPSSATDFTPMEALQGWTDLVIAGIMPAKVRVVGYAGRQISQAELALALALGARVGVIENAALPKDRQFLDPAWQNHPNLFRLPMDAMTLRAFLQINAQPLSVKDKQRLENAARLAHEDYAKSAASKDPSLAPWKELPDSLKLSNYLQVAYWEKVLHEHGLGIRPLSPEDLNREPLNMADALGEAGIARMAEMEHGRWNIERLSYGWRHAKTKDIPKKLNPCLVPWTALTDINGTNYQPYDVEAVRGLPKKLREANLELYKL